MRESTASLSKAHSVFYAGRVVRGAGRFDGQEFRRLRQAAGLSQERVAQLVGATRWQVIAYEQGRATPEPPRLAALAAAVGCAPAILAGAAADADGLAGLRRAAGLTRELAAARLGEQLGGRVPASRWLLEQTETGSVPVAWRPAARRDEVVGALARVYGQPPDAVAAAWPSAATKPSSEQPPPTTAPSKDFAARPPSAPPAHTRDTKRRDVR